jgi:hypothetical protein
MSKQLVFRAKPNSGILAYSSAPEATLFNTVFKNEEAKKRVDLSRGYRYHPSQEWKQTYQRIGLRK